MLPPLAGHRILVVDDERSIASAVARRLEKGGAVCTTVNSGGEAEELLAGAVHDLLLTDIQMPGRTGLELLDRAMALVDPPAVILMASPSDLASATEALQRGAEGYLCKPLDLELVAHETGRVLELRRLRSIISANEATRASGPALLVLGEVINAAEKGDPYRAGFSSRTARLATALAKPLGLSGDHLALAARVHDVGMLAVPVTEQHAAGPMARPVQHLVRVHPTLGARWIERLGADRSLVAAVAAHHERWDGTGYPGALAGTDIPPLARALGTAAAVAAMSGSRAWRDKLTVEDMVDQLVQGRLTQFGADEADATITLLTRMPELVT
jgi:putative two-component system response regulator